MSIKSIKFGGTSMGSSESIMECASIVKEKALKSKVIVTVSAVGGVTDQLSNINYLATKQKPRLIVSTISNLEKQHKNILSNIIKNDAEAEYLWMQELDLLFKKLKAISYGAGLVGDITDKTQAQIYSFGEKFSSLLMHYALKIHGVKSERVISERLIRTDSKYLEANVNFDTTSIATKKILKPLLDKNIVPVVTGFVAKDTHGDTTTLGRGGSDYTASILAMAMDAKDVEIWTDVDGIMSADPRVVDDAISWDHLNLELMSEIAFSGAKVVHPATITLAIKKNISVYVFNTFNKKFSGTKITKEVKDKGTKGVISDSGNILIHLEHPIIIDHVGFISQVASIVASHNISIDVCATSEISFSFSIKSDKYSSKLHKELEDIASVSIHENVTKLCVIGHNMSKNYEFMSSLYELFAQQNIPIHTVSIGASYNNITIIIDDKNKNKSVRSLHNKMFGRSL